MITPKQAAETLEVSSSTLRRWASEFEPFLSLRRGVKRTYTVDDIAIFSRIKELYRQGLETQRVKEVLPVIEQSQEQQDKTAALITVPGFARALEAVQANNIMLRDELSTQAAMIEELKREIEELKKPWYKRLFGKQ